MKIQMSPIRVCVLTVSDRSARGERADGSGPALVKLLTSSVKAEVLETRIVPDDGDIISSVLVEWSKGDLKPDLILTTGGTGLAPRDNTPEATARVLERRHPALLELARYRCFAITPKTFLSRGESGTIGKTLILNLPGSPRGATEMLEAILDILPHAIETLRGDVKDG